MPIPSIVPTVLQIGLLRLVLEFKATTNWKDHSQLINVGITKEHEDAYRTVVKGGPADSNGREAGGLWASGLHVAHAVPRAAVVHVNSGTRWVGGGEAAAIVGRMWGRRRAETLCCRRRRSLVVVHHCKGNREVGLWLCCLVGYGRLRPVSTRRPCRHTTHLWSRPSRSANGGKISQNFRTNS